MNKNFLRAIAILLLMIVLAACGVANPPATTAATEPEVEPTATEVISSSTLEATATLDPCILPQLETEVQEVHIHMREFDDASALASSIQRDQLSTAVAELQRIRREAQDKKIPACLNQLRDFQVQHMNTVIETLLAFMRGNVDDQTIQQAMGLARQQHDQYTLELARVLGLTVVPATIPPAPSETPTP